MDRGIKVEGVREERTLEAVDWKRPEERDGHVKQRWGCKERRMEAKKFLYCHKASLKYCHISLLFNQISPRRLRVMLQIVV